MKLGNKFLNGYNTNLYAVICGHILILDNVCVCVSGSGSLRAKFELSNGPSIPATLAVQFFNEGSTLSGVEMELVGSGYRLSLNKKRLVSGKTICL